MRELVRQVIPADAARCSVGRWLARELKLSARLVRRLKAVGGIRVNGEPRRTVDLLGPGDELVVAMPPAEAPNVAPEPVPLAIAYEDEDVIVLDKPPGVVVHPTHGVYGGTLANGLAWLWAQRGEPAGIHPVHRIDRDTSGLIVFAKHTLAHQRLDVQLRAHRLERAYEALAWGQPAADRGTVDAPIALAGAHPVERAVDAEGQAARTHWEVVRRLAGAVRLRLTLETGRTHQIRVHMASIGHPLVGDTLYAAGHPSVRDARLAAGPAPTAPRQALHAATLGFAHPRTGAPMRFSSAWPEDLAAAERALTSPT